MITYKQLKQEIMALGFCNSSEFVNYQSSIIPAVNTAISDLSNISAKKHRTYRLVHCPCENVIEHSDSDLSGIFEHGSEDIIFEAASGRAYAFFCSGNADVYIETFIDNTWQTVNTIECVPSNQCTFNLYRGFITASGYDKLRIRFSGNYVYQIKGPAIYSQLLSGSEEDIQPYEKYIAYDMKALTNSTNDGEFLSFDDKLPVCTAVGYKPCDCYAVQSDSIILLPRTAKGEYIISYLACPRFISDSTPESAVIDLPQDAARLVPLYAASRAFRDDDKELCKTYSDEYEKLKQQMYHDMPVHTEWTSYYGW